MYLGLVFVMVGEGGQGDVDVAAFVGEEEVAVGFDVAVLEDDAVVDSL